MLNLVCVVSVSATTISGPIPFMRSLRSQIHTDTLHMFWHHFLNTCLITSAHLFFFFS
jgi:hypothetical protein